MHSDRSQLTVMKLFSTKFLPPETLEVVSMKKISSLKEKETLLTFIKQTKEGKFVNIDNTSLAYIILKEKTEEPYYFEEDYYYSIR